MTETQAGIPLTLEIDLIDITTCAPIVAYVDFWSCNATGFYSGYVTASASQGGGSMSSGGPTSNNASSSASGSSTRLVTLTTNTTSTATLASVSAPAAMSMSMGDGMSAGGGAGGGQSAPTDQESFLRGITKSNDSGHVTMDTIVSDFCSRSSQC